MRRLYWMVPMVLFLFATGDLNAQPVSELGEFSEPVTSLAAYEGSGIALLTKDAKVILVDAKGKTETVFLPNKKDGSPADFCDLSLKGTTAYLCRFQEPVLYLLDLKKTGDGYKSIALKKFPNDRQVINVFVRDNHVLITDTANTVSVVDENGGLSPLPPKTVAVPTSKDSTVQLIPASGSDEKSVWNVSLNGEKNILSRSAPSKDVRVRNIRLIGFDQKDRLIFIEATGKGVTNNIFTLYAAKDGTIVSSLVVDGPGRINVARYHALLGDGSVAFLRPGKTQPLRLIRVLLP